jgi:hypothetical protein
MAQHGIAISINQLPFLPDIGFTMSGPWDAGALDR